MISWQSEWVPKIGMSLTRHDKLTQLKDRAEIKARSTISHSRRFTLECMTPKCIARVARAKTPSAVMAKLQANMGKTYEGCLVMGGMMRKLPPSCIHIMWAPYPWAILPHYLPYLLCLLVPHLFHHHRLLLPQIRSVIWRTWTRCSEWRHRTLTSTVVSFFQSPLRASSSCTGSSTSTWAMTSLMTSFTSIPNWD